MVHGPYALVGRVVVPGGVLLCVSDEEGPANILNIERSKAWKDVVIVEHLRAEMNSIEVCIVDLNPGSAEICDIQETGAVDVGGGGAFVHRAVR